MLAGSVAPKDRQSCSPEAHREADERSARRPRRSAVRRELLPGDGACRVARLERGRAKGVVATPQEPRLGRRARSLTGQGDRYRGRIAGVPQLAPGGALRLGRLLDEIDRSCSASISSPHSRVLPRARMRNAMQDRQCSRYTRRDTGNLDIDTDRSLGYRSLIGGHHLRALDGLRGVAILAVLLQHAGVLPVGWLGVDLFFALSGYLITGILLDAKASGARMPVVLRRFYARRALRIFPLGFFALVVVFVVLPLATQRVDLRTPLSTQLWYWSYLSNWRNGDSTGALVYLRHFWSLAVEEQFYLIWPFVALMCSTRRLYGACIGILVAGLALRFALPLMDATGQVPILSSTLTRADSLAVGALIALLHREKLRWSIDAVAIYRLGVLSAAAVALLMVQQRSGSAQSRNMQIFGLTLVAMSMGAAVYCATQDGPVARALAIPWLVGLGRISYGIYVYHAPIGIWLEAHVASGPLRALCLIGCSVPIAAASWRWFESPILRAKSRFPMPASPRTLRAGDEPSGPLPILGP